MEAVEKSNDHKINMGVWHEGKIEGVRDKCEVCFAGSVMANSFKVPPDHSVVDSKEFDEDSWKKFQVLNSVRNGILPHWNGIQGRAFPLSESYHSNRDVFKSEIRQLITDLKNRGE